MHRCSQLLHEVLSLHLPLRQRPGGVRQALRSKGLDLHLAGRCERLVGLEVLEATLGEGPQGDGEVLGPEVLQLLHAAACRGAQEGLTRLSLSCGDGAFPPGTREGHLKA